MGIISNMDSDSCLHEQEAGTHDGERILRCWGFTVKGFYKKTVSFAPNSSIITNLIFKIFYAISLKSVNAFLESFLYKKAVKHAQK